MALKFREVALNLLRIVSGFLFICHGSQKLFGLFGFQAVPLPTKLGVAGLIEVFGGLAIMVGIFTRPIAFIASGEMVVAYWTVHVHMGLVPITNHGEPAVLFCFIFLFLAANGGGRFSLDGKLRQSG